MIKKHMYGLKTNANLGKNKLCQYSVRFSVSAAVLADTGFESGVSHINKREKQSNKGVYCPKNTVKDS